MRNAIVILMSVFICLTSEAQDANEDKSKVLTIKKSKEYIYGEGTGENEEDCYAIAKEKLMDKVKAYIAKDPELSKADGVVIENVKNKTKKLTYERTLRIKVVCLYVKKSDIYPIYRSDSLTDSEKQLQDDRDTQTISIISTKKNEEEETSQTETVDTETTSNPPITKEIIGNYSETEHDLLQKLIPLKKFQEVKSLLAAYKESNRNILYRLEKSGFNMRECFWVVFDKEQNVVALLDKEKTFNILNNSSVSPDTYYNNPKYWIQIYE